MRDIKLHQITMRKNFDFLFLTTLIYQHGTENIGIITIIVFVYCHKHNICSTLIMVNSLSGRGDQI